MARRPVLTRLGFSARAVPGGSGELGQGLAEYALILALIAIVAIVALIFLGGQISTILSDVSSNI